MWKPGAPDGSSPRVVKPAVLLSGLIHLMVGAGLVWASASREGPPPGFSSPTTNSRDGTQQLKGDQAKRAVGRDRLFEILSADDAVRVRLTSPTGDPAVGLAWWSPSRGMWLAVDLAHPYAGQSLRAWEGRRERARPSVASVELDAKGSGRVVAVWSGSNELAPTDPITLTVTAQRGIWPFVQTSVVLTGTEQ
jgi:hypothetical protein